MKNKVLIIDNSPAFTGALKSIIAFAKILTGQFDFVFCIPTGSSANVWLEENGFSYVLIPFLEVRKVYKTLLYPFSLIMNSLKILSLIKKENIKVVHVNDLYNMTGVVIKLLRPKTKLVYHVRLLRTSYAQMVYSFWTEIIDRYADAIIACSVAVKNSTSLKDNRVIVIYDTFNFVEKHLSVSRPDDTVNLLYLANFIPGKGHDKAIEAFFLAFRENPKLRLLMAGSDMGLNKNKRYKKTLIDRVTNEKMAQVIRFSGFEHDTEKLIKSAHIFLNFSGSESFSMTCLETLVYGTPLIVTDCGGPAELFENMKSGWLVPVNDINAMKDAILCLASNPALRDKFSVNGKAFARTKFNSENSASQMARIYSNLIGHLKK